MKHKKLFYIIPIAFVIIAISIFIGMGINKNNGEYRELVGFNSSQRQALYFGEHSFGSTLVLNDNHGKMYSINEDDDIIVSKSFEKQIIKVEQSNDKIKLFFSNESTALIEEYDVVSLEKLGEYELPIAYEKIMHIVSDSDNNFYIVEHYSANTVMLCDEDGFSTADIEFDNKIDSLFSTQKYIYVSVNMNLYRFAHGDLENIELFEFNSIPYRFLSDDIFYDIYGDVYKITNSNIERKFKANEMVTDYLYYSLGYDEDIFWVNTSNNVIHSDIHGNVTEKYSVDGIVYAIGTKKAIVLKDEKLYMTNYNSFIEEDEESSREEIEPPDTLPSELEHEDGFVYVIAGYTVSKFKQLFDENITVTKESGEIVTSGAIKTGMEFGEYKIVVVGDCNGTGTVNTADSKEAQNMFLGTSAKSEVYFRAADIDRDKEITTADLVLLSKLIDSEN